MRWVSFVAVISAATLPVVSARPRCRPEKKTTTSEVTPLSDTTTLTSIATGDIYTTTTTALEISVTHATTTLDSSTAIIETTTATIPETSTDLDSATTAEISTIDPTTTAAATITQAAEPVLYIKNGGFEDQPNTAWSVQNSGIKTDPAKASSGSNYIQYDVVNSFATGVNKISQNIQGLSTERLYRLSFSSVVFSNPAVFRESSTICVIQGNLDIMRLAQWRLDFDNLDQYKANFVNFTPNTENAVLALSLRCSDGKVVTISTGIDNISIVDIGPKLVG
ncbi:hypothetical protein NW768_011274 [Fusarium equiseti]|uniref:CBM-cenC domain-containing protein n=1 Tax=Fusarium equiseti TaxID=61235 RepID=A0ABQ8QY53_FUSEQ|nr:hypothetical protein NW768_011274 [Fusarium equiseti]